VLRHGSHDPFVQQIVLCITSSTPCCVRQPEPTTSNPLASRGACRVVCAHSGAICCARGGAEKSADILALALGVCLSVFWWSRCVRTRAVGWAGVSQAWALVGMRRIKQERLARVHAALGAMQPCIAL
jgi:hypothetical protein